MNRSLIIENLYAQSNNSLIIPASTTGGTATRVYIIEDATDRTTANKYTLNIKTAGSSSPVPVPVGSTLIVRSIFDAIGVVHDVLCFGDEIFQG